MTATEDTPENDPEDEPVDEALVFETLAREMVVEHLEALREMRAMGLELARAVFRRGMARAEGAAEAAPEGEAPPPEPDPGLAFSRITRAVRLCMAMEARTLAEEQARRAGLAAARVVQTSGNDDRQVVRDRLGRLLDVAQERTDRTEAVRRGVENVIRAQVAEGGRALELVAELRERLVDLEDWDLYRGDWSAVEGAIARVARDLGLNPQGARWEPQGDAPPPKTPVNRGPEVARAGVAGLKALYEEFAPSG